MEGKPLGLRISSSRGSFVEQPERAQLKGIQFHGIIERQLAELFSRVGLWVGRNPRRSIGWSLLVAIAFACLIPAMLTFEADPIALYIPQRSALANQRRYIEETFGIWDEPGILIVRHKTPGASITTKEFLLDAMALHQRVQGVSAINTATGKRVRMADVCANRFVTMTGDYMCAVLSVLEQWGYSADKLSSDTDLAGTLAEAHAHSEIDLGGMTVEPSGHVNAQALQIKYFFNVSIAHYHDGGTLAWDRALRVLIDDVNAHSPQLQVSYWSALFIEEEAQSFVAKDSYLMALSMIFIMLYVCIALGGITYDIRTSRMLLGTTSAVCVSLAMAAGFGLGALCGYPFTPINPIIVFTLLGVSVDDMIIIVEAFEHTQPGAPVEQRLSESMAVSGSTITVTSFTSACVFFTAYWVDFPALTNFCIPAGFCVLSVYGLQLFFFAGCLVLDTLRQERGEADCVPCYTPESDEAASYCNQLKPPPKDWPIGSRGPRARGQSGQGMPGPERPERAIKTWMRTRYPELLLQPRTRVAVVLGFLIPVLLAARQIPTITVGLPLRQTLAKSSPVLNYVDDLERYWKGAQTQEAWLVYKHTNVTDAQALRATNQAMTSLTDLDSVLRIHVNWMAGFHDWYTCKGNMDWPPQSSEQVEEFIHDEDVYTCVDANDASTHKPKRGSDDGSNARGSVGGISIGTPKEAETPHPTESHKRAGATHAPHLAPSRPHPAGRQAVGAGRVAAEPASAILSGSVSETTRRRTHLGRRLSGITKRLAANPELVRRLAELDADSNFRRRLARVVNGGDAEALKASDALLVGRRLVTAATTDAAVADGEEGEGSVGGREGGGDGGEGSDGGGEGDEEGGGGSGSESKMSREVAGGSGDDVHVGMAALREHAAAAREAALQARQQAALSALQARQASAASASQARTDAAEARQASAAGAASARTDAAEARQASAAEAAEARTNAAEARRIAHSSNPSPISASHPRPTPAVHAVPHAAAGVDTHGPAYEPVIRAVPHAPVARSHPTPGTPVAHPTPHAAAGSSNGSSSGIGHNPAHTPVVRAHPAPVVHARPTPVAHAPHPPMSGSSRASSSAHAALDARAVGGDKAGLTVSEETDTVVEDNDLDEAPAPAHATPGGGPHCAPMATRLARTTDEAKHLFPNGQEVGHCAYAKPAESANDTLSKQCVNKYFCNGQKGGCWQCRDPYAASLKCVPDLVRVPRIQAPDRFSAQREVAHCMGLDAGKNTCRDSYHCMGAHGVCFQCAEPGHLTRKAHSSSIAHDVWDPEVPCFDSNAQFMRLSGKYTCSEAQSHCDAGETGWRIVRAYCPLSCGMCKPDGNQTQADETKGGYEVAVGGRDYESDVVVGSESQEVAAHRIVFSTSMPPTFVDVYDTYLDQKKALDDLAARVGAEGVQLETFVYHIQYEFAYADWVMPSFGAQNLSMAAGAVLVCVALFLPVSIALLCTFAVLCIDVLLLGGMAVLQVPLNTITLVSLLLAMALAIDYSCHIGHAYVIAPGATRLEKTHHALEYMGFSVLNAGLSTLLGTLFLAASQSPVFRIFFVAVWSTILLGLIAGLAFVPVMLSYLGPLDDVPHRASSRSNLHSSSRPSSRPGSRPVSHSGSRHEGLSRMGGGSSPSSRTPSRSPLQTRSGRLSSEGAYAGGFASATPVDRLVRASSS